MNKLTSRHHPTMKFTAVVFDTETTLLDTNVLKGEILKKRQ